MKRLAMPARFLAAASLLALLNTCQVAWGVNKAWVGPDLGSWNVDANWTFGFGPDASFNEAALINNGGTAVLQGPAQSSGGEVNVGGLKLGVSGLDPPGDSENGGLRIVSGGLLMNVATPNGSETGAITVGAGAGTGTLTIIGNGTLSGTSLSLGGSSSSSISLSDTASLAVSGAANLSRTTTVSGPGVNFSAGGDLTLGSASKLIADIRSSTTHSPLRTEGVANVAGTIKPMFTGVTPSVGNKWTLISAPTEITGEFAALDASMAPALPIGQAYQLFEETIGSRRLLQLGVQEVLILQVNRQTGATSIANVGTSPKQLDGYSIISPHGSLTGSWNSLDDQNVGGADRWLEAPPGPNPNDLSELHPQAGGTTVSAGGSLMLGAPYVVTVPALGVDPDDLSFEYTTPDERIVKGLVTYTGTKTANNFVLTVDPATGQAQMRLDSPFPTAIDGYAVYSASGSLTPATWNSLQDQSASNPSAAGWEQAPPAPSAQAVTELRADGSLTFQSQTGFQLGQLFKTVGGVQDLRLEVFLSGSAVPFVGKVNYGPITLVSPPSMEPVPGDYDRNGVVDGRDLDVWRQQFGSTQGLNADGDQDGDVDGHDFLIWQRNLFLAPPPTGSGDVNGNGVTDISDYIIIRNNFNGTNRTLAQGDLNGDTVVNFADFRHWKNNRTAAVAAAGVVPEPAGWSLGAIGLSLAGTTRRRRGA
jgi:hypothetical protein